MVYFLTAAEYRGPVIVLEPKWMYRQYKGAAFPSEPTDKNEIAKLRKFIMRGGIQISMIRFVYHFLNWQFDAPVQM